MKKKINLSVVINTKNAESTIKRTLESVSFADEIVVVDMHSSDATTKIVKKYTDKLFTHKDVGYVEPARNYAISKAQGNWILIVDADEEVSPGLREFIMALVRIDQKAEEVADCYYIPRKNIIFDKWIQKTGWWPDHVLRLFKKGHVEWSDEIHSVPVTTGKVAELPAEEHYVLLHHNYQTVEQFIDRLNRYTTIEAQNRQSARQGSLIKEFGDEVLRRLFADRGIEEGKHGLSLSFLQAMYQMIISLKIWQKNGFKQTKLEQEMTIKELERFQKDLQYWIADWHVSRTVGLTKLYWKLIRRYNTSYG